MHGMRSLLTAWCLLVALAALGGSRASDAGAAWRDRSFTVRSSDGVRIRAYMTRAHREAPVLVMVNGGPGLSHVALASLGQLGSRRRSLLFYDQRGTGRSTVPPAGAYGLADHVADVEALRRKLGVQRLDVLGHSWGGLIAAAYAAEHPRRVAALVLADAEPLDRRADEEGVGHLGARIVALQRSGRIPASLPPRRGDDCTDNFNALSPAYLSNPTLGVSLLPSGHRACSSLAADRTLAELTDAGRARALRDLRRFHSRSLVVAGRDDPFGARWIAAVRDQVRAARPRVELIPRAGHLPWLESKRFVRAVRAFLRS
jgi:proline iminopeptidase